MIKLRNVKPGMIINRYKNGLKETIYVKYIDLKRNSFWSGPYLEYFDLDAFEPFSCRVDPEELVSSVSENSRKEYIEDMRRFLWVDRARNGFSASIYMVWKN